VTLPQGAADEADPLHVEAPAATTATEIEFESLVRDRFDWLTRRFPVFSTYLGLSDRDGEVADGSRDAIMGDIAAGRAFESQLNGLDTAQLSPYHRIERELALFTVRREIFDDETHRIWERRVNATDEIGDGVFLVFARGTRPLAERLEAIASRLEQAPRHIEEQRSRLGDVPPVRLWNELELDATQSVPSLFEEVTNAAREHLGDEHATTKRLEKASTGASQALEEYSTWLRGKLANANDDFALGSDAYDELVGLRAFDGLDSDAILAIGEEQLASNLSARAEVARQIDAGATDVEVVDRVKSDHPADFAAAMDMYREAMEESRQYVIDHGIASMPVGESLTVTETPEYLRNVMPFAAYFNPPKFGDGSAKKGLYIVTPSVDGDAGAMREHNYASIYNTSIHEAYPGHHQQLAASIANPSVVRLMVDAPEFVEGWAMYCEQMMREEGFDTAPEHMLMMYTDAIWRACRIILDIKLHRGEISVPSAIDFLAKHTGFERPNATAEVNRYTYTPTYQLSYLLGKVLLLRLRDDEKRRLGPDFSLRGFHDAMLREGSLPISFHRRLLAGAAAAF
jgi:uncharacterized protein (DUF885 family)